MPLPAIGTRHVKPAPTLALKRISKRFNEGRLALLQYHPLEWAIVAISGALMLGVLLPRANLPPVDADSGAVLSITRAFVHGDLDVLIDTLSPPVQVMVYSVVWLLGLQAWALTVPIVFSLLLACSLGYVAYRQTKVLAFAALPPLLLLYSPVFAQRTAVLTLYAASIPLAYLGLYFCAQYVLDPQGRRRGALLGSVLLAAALYTWTLSLMLFTIPALFLIISSTRQVLRRLASFYALLIVLAAPWFVWHFAVGGIRWFFFYPKSWLGVKYLLIINNEFWGYPAYSYSDFIPEMGREAFEGLIPPIAWALVPLGLLFVWQKYRLRGLTFLIVALVALALPVFVSRPATNPRYLYHVLPILILLATGGIALLWSYCSRILKPLRPFRAPIIGGIVIVLACGFLWGWAPPEYEVDARTRDAGREETLRLSRFITDGRGIISRDQATQAFLPGNQVYNPLFIEEDDWVTYLSWPDEQEVLTVFNEYNIGWVILRKDLRFEREYHGSWLKTVTGELPRHYLEIEKASNFEKVAAGDYYILYKLKQQSPDSPEE